MLPPPHRHGSVQTQISFEGSRFETALWIYTRFGSSHFLSSADCLLAMNVYLPPSLPSRLKGHFAWSVQYKSFAVTNGSGLILQPLSHYQACVLISVLLLMPAFVLRKAATSGRGPNKLGCSLKRLANVWRYARSFSESAFHAAISST
jgi:hypothetical protein